MDSVIKRLLSRFWPSGALFLGGFLLIIYIGLGILYLQQGAQQKEYQEQINKISPVIARPLPGDEALEAKYDEVNRVLAPISGTKVVADIVSIAEKSGIDVAPSSGKLRIPAVTSGQFKSVTVEGGDYQVLSIGKIYVQGDYENIMAFISDLDSGATLPNMVLIKVSINEIEVAYTGVEGIRRAEFRGVIAAVVDMMNKNDLGAIPNPMSFLNGEATSLMGDDPATIDRVEGFPDIATTAAEKGYTGSGSPRGGYVLYKHAQISTDNTTRYENVSYFGSLNTVYFYTCEADGTVRQFNVANVATATEYFGSEASKTEYIATVDVEIYTRPGKK